MQTENFHSLGLLVIAQDGEVGDDPVRPGAGRQAGGFTGAGTGQISGSGQKIEPGHKTARVLVHHDQDAAAEGGEIIGAAAARQPYAGLGIVTADQSGIQIPIRVDLGAAQESVIHQAALAGLHHIAHAGGHHASIESARVTDADGHGGQLGGHAAGLKEDHQLRSRRPLGQHGGGAGRAGADRNCSAVFQ